MATHSPHRPHHLHSDLPEDPEPGLHPVEPDQGQVPPVVPDQNDGGQTDIPEV